MKKKNQLLAILAVGVLAGPTASQADSEIQLIDHPGATDTQVFGINNRGDVVGNGFADPTALPFVYSSRRDTLTDVAPAAGYFSTSVLGISHAGIMVGSVDSLDGLTRSGFIRGTDGTYTVFSHPDALSQTNPRGVNNQRLVSGFRDSADGTLVAFIYDSRTETFTDIDNGESIQTIAHGINSRGEVVGNSFFLSEDDPCNGSAAGSANYGWLRAADGSITYFQVNGQSTRARGVNDSGSIVGFVTDPGDGKLKGFNVQLDGSNCQSITIASGELLEVMGFETTFPEGITNSGVIVGSAGDFGGASHGFIVRPR